ncbi:MAG TPA: Uma2 family endonuclease [Pirellulales bacterium]|nr:Uma2 family endonuclease [Pirellulales bacterium]
MATVPRSSNEIHQSGRKPPPPGPLTEEEFLDWCDEDTKAEWVDGKVVLMSPANVQHALLSGFFYRVLSDFVDHHRLGTAFNSDLMIRLKDGRLRIPDLSFLTNQGMAMLSEKLCDGAPELLAEIVSPDSKHRDWHDKYAEYEAEGVAEYWIVDPLEDRLAAFTLRDGKRYSPIAEKDGKIASIVVRGFYLRPAWLFGDEIAKVADVLKELTVGHTGG